MADRENIGDNLRGLATLFEERDKVYGATYKRVGYVLAALFDFKTVKIRTAEDWNRACNLMMMQVKFCRYGKNFEKLGHDDSLDDLAVCTQFQRMLDNDARDHARVEVLSDEAIAERIEGAIKLLDSAAYDLAPGGDDTTLDPIDEARQALYRIISDIHEGVGNG